ncbi:MAG: cellulose biosynthesis cyclic di-GMP-binding regulatory protein BcsB, partial [Terracidiphilus sp.]
QTPQHFYSPDPFERNLGQFRAMPNEGELFYGVVQDGNDFWNATFFCGSCAVLRRRALDQAGGIAVETVTEDAHTSLRMQMQGWSTAYINIPQAAGLATGSLAAHVEQRIRWARGMIQILRTENPLFAPGLKFGQRLCYFNAMCHFLYAVPRLIFLTAPLIFLLLHRTNFPGYWAAILAFALPHLTLATVTNSRIQGEHRYSFWNEIYETVLSPYILIPTVMAFFRPRQGRFNVTPKSAMVKYTFFDSRIALPFVILLLLNLAGLALAVPRFFIWDHDRPGTVLMNAAWCCFNVIILGVCIAVAREMRQMRSNVRIDLVTPLMARLPDGRLIAGETIDMSSGGASIRFAEDLDCFPQTQVRLIFPLPALDSELRATVVSSEGSVLRVHFEDLTIPEQEALTMVLYSPADSWLGWSESRKSDNVLGSLARILRISLRGLLSVSFSLLTGKDRKARRAGSVSILRSAVFIFLAALLAGSAQHIQAQGPGVSGVGAGVASAIPGLPPGQFRDSFTLSDLGLPPIELRGTDNKHEIDFPLSRNRVVRYARLHLFYAFSPSLLPQLSHIKLLMNGTLFATVQPLPGQAGGSDSREAEADFTIPPELLARANTLTIQFIGHCSMVCDDPANSSLWARVQPTTFLDIRGDLTPLPDDVKQLPAPFLDPPVTGPLSIPIVFLGPPSFKAIQAAGVIASYLGQLSENRPVRFPVHVGVIPRGNAIVISDTPGKLPPGLILPNLGGPTVAMRANPNDPYSKILLLAGGDADQALIAAQAAALHSTVLAGPRTTIDGLQLPGTQQLDAAPRWSHTDQTIALGDQAATAQFETDGSAPLKVYFRIPPDLFYAARRPSALLRLHYSYNPAPIASGSSMQVHLNGAFLGSVPLSPGQEPSRQLQFDLAVPVADLRPFSNTLSFDFAFRLPRQGGCPGSAPVNTQGAILPDSFLDLRGYPHYAPLPNLEIFANAGFPFTALADLSQSTVVLPAVPTAQEIETFLTLMGHFSRQTGYPALQVTVAGPDAAQQGAATDLLILGTGDDQPAFDKLANNLPVTVHAGKIQLRDVPDEFQTTLQRAWLKLNSDERPGLGALTAADEPDAVVEAIESPFDPEGGRSIVAIRLKDAAAFEPFMDSFLKVQQSGDISGTVSILRGTRFQSFRVGAEVYHVGELPLWTRVTLWLTEAPWLFVAAILFLVLLMAIVMRGWLRKKARARLTATES